MRGRNFHPYELDRVLADIADARKHGAQAIFLVDDNITPDVRRFQRLCEARIFTVRGSSSSAVLLSATRTTRARRSKRTSRSRMSTEFRNRRLIVNEDVSHYDGTTAVVRTDHLESGEIEFLRWRACLHRPWFVLTHAHRMLAHTFAGTSWRSVCGLEDVRAVFERFRARRRQERQQLLT